MADPDEQSALVEDFANGVDFANTLAAEAKSNAPAMDVLLNVLSNDPKSQSLFIPEMELRLTSSDRQAREEMYKALQTTFSVCSCEPHYLRRPPSGDTVLSLLCKLIKQRSPHQKELLHFLALILKTAHVRHAFIDLFELYNFFIQQSRESRSSSQDIDLAIELLQTVVDLSFEKGPREYFDFRDGKGLFPSKTQAFISRGYSWGMWLRLEKLQQEGERDVFSFMSASVDQGVQTKLRFQKKEFGLETNFVIRQNPEGTENPIMVKQNALRLGVWHFITFSHDPGKGGNGMLSVYIDGVYVDTYPLPYPVIGLEEVQLVVGGFYGQMGRFYFFEGVLTELQVSNIYHYGPTYCTPQHSRDGTLVSVFPPNIAKKPLDVYLERSGYDQIPTIVALDPANHTEGMFLPSGWGTTCSERIEGVNVTKLPNFKSSLISVGGLPFIFFFLSPHFRGAPFLDNRQPRLILQLVCNLLNENTALQRQMATLTLTCLKLYVLQHISYSMRDLQLLNVLKEIILFMRRIDPKPGKAITADGIKYLLCDIPYWARTQNEVKLRLFDFVRGLVETDWKIVRNAVGINGFQDAIKMLLPNAVPSELIRNPKSHEDSSLPVAKVVIDCMLGLAAKTEFSDESHLGLVAMIQSCTDQTVLDLLVTKYFELCRDQFRDSMTDYFGKRKGIACVFIQLLDRVIEQGKQIDDDDDDADEAADKNRTLVLKIIKILQAFLKVREEDGRPKESEELVAKIATVLAQLDFSDEVYVTMIDLLASRVSLTMQSDRDPTRIAEMIIRYPSGLDGLFLMISKVKPGTRVRILTDVLTMLKNNEKNQRVFGRQRRWCQWISELLASNEELDSNQMRESIEKVVIQIAQCILWYFLHNEELGFVAVHHFIKCTRQAFQEGIAFDPRRFYEVIVSVFLSVMNRLLLDKVSSNGNDLSDISNQVTTKFIRNLIVVLHTVEIFVMNDSVSLIGCSGPDPNMELQSEEEIDVDKFFNPGTPEINFVGNFEKELMCLGKLLKCTLKFIPFKNWRQLVLRRVLRFLKAVLPHPRCSALYDEIIAGTEEFMNRLSSRKLSDLKTVRIAYTFLRRTERVFAKSETLFGERRERIESIMQEMYCQWGDHIFATGGSDPDPVPQVNRNALPAWEVQSEKLEQYELHQHSIFVLLAHQKRFEWEYEQTKQRLSKDLDSVQKKDQRSLVRRKEKFESFISDAEQDLYELTQQDNTRIMKAFSKHLNQRKNDYRQLQKYLEFFREDYEARYGGGTKFYKLDEVECPTRRRVIVRPDFQGSSHEEAKCTKGLGAKQKQQGMKLDLQGLSVASPDPERIDSGDGSDAIQSPQVQEQEEALDDWIQVDYDPDEDEQPTASAHQGRLILTTEATNISPLFKMWGEIILTDTHFVFEPTHFTENIPRDVSKMNGNEPGNDEDLDEDFEVIHLSHGQIRQALPRRYLLRENGLEIFTNGHTNYFFAFPSTKARNNVFTQICKCSKHRISWELSPQKRLRQSGITRSWQKRKISNFDYLMHLNTLAGRSYNDITQYPVMPWIIADYKSEKLDFKSPDTFRDLTKPIGALNAARLRSYVQRYEEAKEDGTFPPFHYGSHYSSAGVALHYLVRIEPYTTLAIHLQNGKFDLPDRLFHSVEQAWDLSMNNMHDVKELIPEFFYFPSLFSNWNRLPLGTKQEGGEVDDVVMPPWASSPDEFVHLNRQALESEYVSQHLHHWIDLIFGFKQQGEEAEKACNKFVHVTYAGAVNPDAIDDPQLREATESQIMHFGQTPNQLFTQPHPERLPAYRCEVNEIILPFSNFPRDYTPIYVRPFSNTSSDVTRKYRLRCGSWDGRKSSNELVVLTPDCEVHVFHLPSLSSPSGSDLKARTPFKVLSENWLNSCCGGENSVDLSRNCQFAVVTGFLDTSVKIISIRTGETLCSISAQDYGHNDFVTACKLAQDQQTLVTGANDGSVVIWYTLCKHKNYNPKHAQLCRPHRLLTHHKAQIVDIAISSHLGLCCTIAADSTIALFSIRSKTFLRPIYVNGEGNPQPPPGTVVIHSVLLIKAGYLILHTTETEDPNGRPNESYLRLLSINGTFVRKLKTGEPINSMLLNAKHDILITGGYHCEIVFRDSFTFEPLQVIPVQPSGATVPTTKPTESLAMSQAPSYIEHIEIDPEDRFLIVAYHEGFSARTHVLCYPIPNRKYDAQFSNFYEMAVRTFDEARRDYWNTQNDVKPYGYRDKERGKNKQNTKSRSILQFLKHKVGF